MRPQSIRISTACLAVGFLFLANFSSAQEVFSFRETMDFDRPESWALKTFSTASLMTPLGSPLNLRAGEIRLGLELGSIPHLNAEQRRVGFNGLKEENLNRSPMLARPRVSLGLGAGFVATLAWIPPLELDGAETDVLSLAVQRALWQGESHSLALRAFGQIGTSEGDFTCSDEDAQFTPGSPQNLFGCNDASADEAQLDHYGLALIGGYELPTHRPVNLFWGLYALHLDLEFQVNAPVFGAIDRTLLVTDGETYAASLGVGGALLDRGLWSAELLYSPLDVKRPGEDSTESDDFLNLRLLLSVPLR